MDSNPQTKKVSFTTNNKDYIIRSDKSLSEVLPPDTVVINSSTGNSFGDTILVEDAFETKKNRLVLIQKKDQGILSYPILSYPIPNFKLLSMEAEIANLKKEIEELKSILLF
jgi:hypothetical protein